MKMDVFRATSTADEATVLAESSEYIHFHHDLSAPAISTDMSQVGVTLFPSFLYIFLSFHLSRFSFYIYQIFSNF
jgi:hypothetical protein